MTEAPGCSFEAHSPQSCTRQHSHAVRNAMVLRMAVKGSLGSKPQGSSLLRTRGLRNVPQLKQGGRSASPE